MRIALIATSLRLAGAEKQFSYAARTLHRAGVDVRVFYLGESDYYQKVLTDAGVPLRQIYNHGEPLLMLMRLVKQLAVWKPQVVLASQFGDLIFAGLAGRLCGALVVGGVRSDGFYEIRTAGRRSWPMLKLTHGLIANSDRAKDNLVSLGIDPRRIAVLSNVIDLARFDHDISVPLDTARWVNRIPITAVGSLQPCKRFDRFLGGLALAREREPSLLGVIAGRDLGEMPALEQKAKSLGLFPGHLEFLGECENIPSLLAHSRLLVTCSEYEGFPNVLLEAMAARLPVLTTPVGDSARIVKDGKAGYMLEPDNTEEMAERILSLVREPALARQMGEMGRKLVEQQFNLASLAPRLMSTFCDFATKHGRKSIPRLLGQNPTVNTHTTPRVSTNGLSASTA